MTQVYSRQERPDSSRHLNFSVGYIHPFSDGLFYDATGVRKETPRLTSSTGHTTSCRDWQTDWKPCGFQTDPLPELGENLPNRY
jgi:hypothetical protein